MTNEKNNMGFSGLLSLTSDITEAVGDSAHADVQRVEKSVQRHKKEAQKSTRQEAEMRPESDPPLTPDSQSEFNTSGTSDTTKPRTSGLTMIVVLAVVFVLIYIFHISQEKKQEPRVPSINSQASNLQSNTNLQILHEQVSSLEFSKPSAGNNKILSVEKIRWCLREEIRIEFFRPKTTTNDQVNKFNAMVKHYNSRCGSFRYRPGTFKRAQRDVENLKEQIIANISPPW